MTRTIINEDRRPRDRKRTHQAKQLTQARKAQRRAKAGA